MKEQMWRIVERDIHYLEPATGHFNQQLQFLFIQTKNELVQ